LRGRLPDLFGEYGYMEEGKLGRVYDSRLLLRLAGYISPYWKKIAFTLCLTLLIAVADLAVPYLTKIAIDRYIVSSWSMIHTESLNGGESDELIKGYRHLFIETVSPPALFVFHGNMGRIDPRDLRSFRAKGVIKNDEKYYLIAPGSVSESLPTGTSAFQTNDGATLILHSEMASIPHREILKIRASDINGVALLGSALLVLVMISFCLGYGEHFMLELLGQRIMQDIRLALFKRMQAKRVPFFDRHPVGRLVTRATNDVENLNEMFKSVIITVCKDILIITGILAVLVYLNWRLAILCFLFLPIITGVTFLFSSMSREVFRQLRAAVAKINSFLQERLSGMKVVQLFVTEAHQMDIFSQINRENYRAGMRQVRIFGVFMPIMEILSSGAIALIIWYGGGKVVSESLTLGALVAFISYMQMFFKPIRDIAEKYNIMQAAMASTERIFEFMDEADEMPQASAPYSPEQFKGHLVFKDVSFSYRKGEPVLSGVSFEIRPGETVALVGPTGSGKTTIIHLLERFYDPDEGTILLDGVDLKEWDQKRLHELLGLVMQDVFIFSGTVEENIRLGSSDSSKAREAACTANAYGFIQRLPSGMNEVMGEAGASLSTGQRQLLSFARALAKNPGLLILDEATSSVDPETERLIQDAIGRMTARRTTLVVAHRLSTVMDAGRILVVMKGRIAEQGTHEELMRLGGTYRKLQRLQARGSGYPTKSG